MTILRNQFEGFFEKHSPIYVLKSSVKPRQLKCVCSRKDTFDESDYDLCPKCLGTEHVYQARRIQLRKTSQGAGGAGSGTLTTDKIHADDDIVVQSQSARFFHKIDEPVKAKDFIIEKTPNDYNIYMVRNVMFQTGDQKEPIYKVSLASLLDINDKDKQAALLYIRKEMEARKMLEKFKYIGDIPESIYDTQEFIKEDEIKSIIEHIIKYEGVLSDVDAYDVIYEKYGLENVGQSLDYILAHPLQIEYFDNDAEMVELGTVLEELILHWGYVGEPEKQYINGNEIDINLRQLNLKQTIDEDTTFTLKAKGGNDTKVKNTNIKFRNGIYYGSSYKDLSVDDLLGSLERELTDRRQRTLQVNVADDQYLYYVYPSRLGISDFYVGQFEGGFLLEDTVQITNSSGYTEQYYIYRTENPSLGLLNVDVK